jgi:hypothetical protein
MSNRNLLLIGLGSDPFSVAECRAASRSSHHSA